MKIFKRHLLTRNHWTPLRYYEHPLSAATNAMLTANGAGNTNQAGHLNEDESQQHSGALNMNSLVTSHQVNNANGSTTYLYEYYKVPEKEAGSIQWR